MSKDRRNILILFVIGLIFARNDFWNYGDIGMAFLLNDMMLLKAKDAGISFVTLINDMPAGYCASLYQHTYNYPLSVFLVHLLTKIFGFSPYNIAYLAIITYFTTIVAAYYLGSILVDRRFGFVFGLLFAVDVYFNVNVRTGSGIFFLTPLLLISCVSFFLMGHRSSYNERKRLLFLIVSAFLLSLCFFHGYGLTFISLPILVIFALLLSLKNHLRLNIKKTDAGYDEFESPRPYVYALFLVQGGLFYLLVSLSWDLYTGAELYTTINRTWGGSFARQASPFVPLDEYYLRICLVFYDLFVDMDKNGIFALGGIHSDTSCPGEPFIPYLLSPFFIFGFYSSLKERALTGWLFVILFLSFCYVLVMHFQPYAPRVWVPITLFVLLIVTKGCLDAYKALEGSSYGNYLYPIVGLFLVLILFVSYNKVSFFTHERGGNKIWQNGQPGIVKLLSDSPLGKNNALIIMGDKPSYGWLQYVYVNKERNIDVLYKQDRPNCMEEKSLQELLTNYDNVFVVAPASFYSMSIPGKNYSNPIYDNYNNYILKNYPTWLPKRVILSNINHPLHYIFDVRECMGKNTLCAFVERMGENYLTVGVKEKPEIKPTLKRIHFDGGVNKISIKNEDTSWEQDLNFSSDNMHGYIADGISEVTFHPFHKDTKANVLEMKNMVLVNKDGLQYYELTKAYGHIIFEFKFPFTIEFAEIMTNPCIFNDYYKSNWYSASYSTNGKNYKEFAKIRSNGNERYGRQSLPSAGGDAGDPSWPGKTEYVTYNIISPEEKVLYIKISFYNKHFYQRNSKLFFDLQTTMFKFRLNSTLPGNLYLTDKTNICIHKKGAAYTSVSLVLSKEFACKEFDQEIELPGSDFEQWAVSENGETPIGWNKGANGTYIKSTDSLNGNYSIEMTGGEVCCQEINRVTSGYQRIGECQTFTAFVKANGPGICALRIMAIFTNGKTKEYYSDYNTKVNAWEKLTVSKKITPDVLTLLIAIHNFGGKDASILVDDASFTRNIVSQNIDLIEQKSRSIQDGPLY